MDPNQAPGKSHKWLPCYIIMYQRKMAAVMKIQNTDGLASDRMSSLAGCVLHVACMPFNRKAPFSHTVALALSFIYASLQSNMHWLIRVRSCQQYRGSRQWRWAARCTSIPTVPSRTSLCWMCLMQTCPLSACSRSPQRTIPQCQGTSVPLTCVNQEMQEEESPPFSLSCRLLNAEHCVCYGLA